MPGRRWKPWPGMLPLMSRRTSAWIAPAPTSSLHSASIRTATLRLRHLLLLQTFIAASRTLPVSRCSFAFLLARLMPAVASSRTALTREAHACPCGTGRRRRRSLVGELTSPPLPNAGDISTSAFWESARPGASMFPTPAVRSGPGAWNHAKARAGPMRRRVATDCRFQGGCPIRRGTLGAAVLGGADLAPRAARVDVPKVDVPVDEEVPLAVLLVRCALLSPALPPG